MPRSHPPTLITTLNRTIREECSLACGTRVLVAVSGGGDSMALLDAIAKRAGAFGLDLVAHGVDHGLRSAARTELDKAEAHALALGVPFSRTALNVEAGPNLQHRARLARYRALREAAAALSATVIATAHHAEDRAETVLLRLLRGSGPRGLGVLPARSGDLVRPLIRATKSQILAHLERHGVPYSEDPSNRDPRFLRVRVRRELLPLLQTLSPNVVGHLNALADQLTHPILTQLADTSSLGVVLNRAQLGSLERASRLHQMDARIRVAGGRELGVDRATGRLFLVDRDAVAAGEDNDCRSREPQPERPERHERRWG